MNTNIDIDEALARKAMALTGLRTKKEVVGAGLKALILLHEQREVRDLRGRLHWDGGAEPKARRRG